MKKRITISLDYDLWKSLKLACMEENISIVRYVQELLLKELKKDTQR